MCTWSELMSGSLQAESQDRLKPGMCVQGRARQGRVNLRERKRAQAFSPIW